MTYHSWYDQDFDFNQLSKIIDWIYKFYYRSTKNYLMMKEKYGTIRYECLDVSMIESSHYLILLDIIYRATLKFPKYSCEIVDDIIPILEIESSGIIAWYKGYFEAILWINNQSRLVTFK